jgi:hypothetical protein
MAVVTAEIVAPRPERGTDGFFQFQTEVRFSLVTLSP